MNNKTKNTLAIGIIVLGGILLLASLVYIVMNNSTDRQTAQNVENIPFPDIPRVDIKDAKAAFDIGNAIFLDVRGDSAYEQGHIPGAKSIFVNDLAQRLDELNPSDWIITYCT